MTQGKQDAEQHRGAGTYSLQGIDVQRLGRDSELGRGGGGGLEQFPKSFWRNCKQGKLSCSAYSIIVVGKIVHLRVASKGWWFIIVYYHLYECDRGHRTHLLKGQQSYLKSRPTIQPFVIISGKILFFCLCIITIMGMNRKKITQKSY